MIKQAVILAGGRGTRLDPVTRIRAKPLVKVNGIPFIEHLIEQLARYGVDEVIVLTGYKRDDFKYLESESNKIRIKIVEGEIEWETGKRLSEARNELKKEFILLYGDNYIYHNLSRLEEVYKEKDYDLALHICEKIPGNIGIQESEDIVISYDPHKRTNSTRYVELGYMICKKKEILGKHDEIAKQGKEDFKFIIQDLSKKGKVGYVRIEENYISIGDVARLREARKIFKNKKIVLLDRDGTLHEKANPERYITRKDQIQYIEKNISGLKTLSNNGYKFIVITNQAGLSTGEVDIAALQQIHEKIKKDLGNMGIEVLEFIVCGDHWNSNSMRRKPNPGMILEACKKYKLRLDESVYIGDDERDVIAANRAGCISIFIKNENHRLKTEKAVLEVNDIEEAAEYIMQIGKER